MDSYETSRNSKIVAPDYIFGCLRLNVWFQKISTTPYGGLLEILRAGGGLKSQILTVETPEGWAWVGIQTMGEVWIFSETT